jgi:LysM repeat protein
VPLETANIREIIVADGETLSSIGRRFDSSPMALKALNNLKSDKILTGQKLLVPIWPKAQSK